MYNGITNKKSWHNSTNREKIPTFIEKILSEESLESEGLTVKENYALLQMKIMMNISIKTLERS